MIRLRHCTVKALIPHHQVHELTAIEVHVITCQAVAAHECVLHNADNRQTVTGTENLVRNRRNLLQLRRRLVALRAVHVHLVAVEVRIVRRRHGDV